jgi:mannose-1-phosphate guanylyltransferase
MTDRPCRSSPKQFLPLFGALSIFQDTVRRVADPALCARPIVVTNGQFNPRDADGAPLLN